MLKDSNKQQNALGKNFLSSSTLSKRKKLKKQNLLIPLLLFLTIYTINKIHEQN